MDIESLLVKMEPYIKDYFFDRLDILEVWNFIKSNPAFTLQILNDIDKAIMLFNLYRDNKIIEKQNIPLPSSHDLRKILKQDLPYVEILIENLKEEKEKTIVKTVSYIKEFEFIKTLRPIENCAGTLLLGCYRCYIRAIFPYVVSKGGQVASSLEEMVAIMALNGEKTKLFHTVRSWYEDYQEEGFSRELSDAVKALS